MLRTKANHAFHRAYKTSTKENWDKYKEARRSKRESWQDFCSKIETMHEPARLHKLPYAYQLFLNYRSSFLKFLVVGPCRGMTNAIIDMAIQPIRQYSNARSFI